MAKKRKKISAEQAAWDERTEMIRAFVANRLGGRLDATDRGAKRLLPGTFEERTQMIRDCIAKLDARIAARKPA